MRQRISQHLNKIQHHFNRASHTYDYHCQLQKETGSRLIHLCKMYHPQSKGILDLGCGTGLMTEQLARSYQYENFHAIDISISLLMKARERLKPYHINIYEYNFDKLKLTEKFNLIFSNMALHWSNDLAKILQSTHTLLQTDGCLAFSIPLAGSLHELQSNYSINTFYNSSEIFSLLHENNFEILNQAEETLTYSFSSTRDALFSLKKVGASHVNTRLHSGLSSRFDLKTINQLTYVIGYFILKKRLK